MMYGEHFNCTIIEVTLSMSFQQIATGLQDREHQQIPIFARISYNLSETCSCFHLHFSFFHSFFISSLVTLFPAASSVYILLAHISPVYVLPTESNCHCRICLGNRADDVGNLVIGSLARLIT